MHFRGLLNQEAYELCCDLALGCSLYLLAPGHWSLEVLR